MKREVTYNGFTTTAEECSVNGTTYYMIGCHAIPAADLDHIGDYVEVSVNLQTAKNIYDGRADKSQPGH
jgi:hypothetical protein